MSSSTSLVLGIVFIVGAALFVVGTIILRRIQERQDYYSYQSEPDAPLSPIAPPEPAKPVTLQWYKIFTGDDSGVPNAPERLDMIERLAMLGEPWCIDTLKQAAAEESDATISNAVRSALQALSGV